MISCRAIVTVFFFNDTATTEIYTLSLHDALPICAGETRAIGRAGVHRHRNDCRTGTRSEEHTSELQSQSNLVCRLLLEKKKSTISGPSACSRPSLHPAYDPRPRSPRHHTQPAGSH